VTTVPAGTVSSFARRASLPTSFFGSIENSGTPARTSWGVVMARCYARALGPVQALPGTNLSSLWHMCQLQRGGEARGHLRTAGLRSDRRPGLFALG